MQLGKGSVPFAKVANFILVVSVVKLDLELTALVARSASATHQRVNWGLFLLLAQGGVVGVAHWHDEVVHEALGNLLTVRVFEEGLLRIVIVVVTVFSTDAVFDSEESESVVVHSACSCFLLSVLESIVRDDSHGVDLEGEVFLQVG